MLLRFDLMLMDENQPPIIEDFGFYHSEDYLFETGQMLVHYKVLPRSGGWDDQDPRWVDDIKVWLAHRERKIWERRQSLQPPNGNEPPDGNETPPIRIMDL